jgi:hypothetical protein
MQLLFSRAASRLLIPGGGRGWPRPASTRSAAERERFAFFRQLLTRAPALPALQRVDKVQGAGQNEKASLLLCDAGSISIALNTTHLCPNGGIGRRARFRTWFSQGSGGSSPLSGTKRLQSFSFTLFSDPAALACWFARRRFRLLLFRSTPETAARCDFAYLTEQLWESGVVAAGAAPWQFVFQLKNVHGSSYKYLLRLTGGHASFPHHPAASRKQK